MQDDGSQRNSDISKTVGPISAEFGVLMHIGPPYSKSYKKYWNWQQNSKYKYKNNSLSPMLTMTDQKLQKS